jgi:putative phage-type endonuclease
MTQDVEQRSEAWFAVRLGKATASKIADVMAKTKSGYSASRANYMSALLIERLTGRREEGFTSAAMQWGTDTEPQARAAYEFMEGHTVEEVGFVDHPSVRMSGASPDGFVGDDGLVEIKCPNTATHLELMLTDKIPAKYISQMQWQMACTGRAWCDFVSFDPRLPENLMLYVRRVARDDAAIADMEVEVTKFLDELDETIAKLMALNEKDAA